MPEVLLFLIVIALVVGIGIAALFRFLYNLASRRAEELMKRFPDARLVVRGANFYGQQSRGVT